MPGRTSSVDTRVADAVLAALGNVGLRLPPDFELQRGVARGHRARRMLRETSGRLGMARSAYATLLQDGHSVRLSGQDSIRGHLRARHAAYHDQQAARSHVPLAHLFDGQPRFEDQFAAVRTGGAGFRVWLCNLDAPTRW